MSGLVALLDTDRGPLDSALLTEMTASMAGRGPDGQGTWATDGIGLGHALLRTTSAAISERQPCSLGDDVWITADARVDARPALLDCLRERGRNVSSDVPDVELILHAYLTWGDSCMDRLIGDFSFVLWDQRRQRLLAARDQLGVAQLFYAQVGTTVLLGNTLDSLLLHPGIAHTLDEQTLADVALFPVYLDDGATAYSAVRRLPPAHKLTWDGRGLRVERYWALRRPMPGSYRRSEECSERFRLLFDQAVTDRVRTDRVGCQLSGGMDSTSVAVTAHQSLKAVGRPFDLRAYAIEYRSLIPDEEGVLAAEVARHAGLPLEVIAGEAYLNAEPMGDRAWTPPEPGAIAPLVMAEVCRRTAAFARVLLTGYGGDPLPSSPDLAWQPAWAALRHGHWKWPLTRLATRWQRRPQPDQPDPLPAWVHPQWARRMDLAERAAVFQRRARREQFGLVEAALWRTLFAWSDAGYHGLPLKIRFPFFDLRLLEFVLSIPPVPWLDDKRLLRAAMGDRLPELVRTRPKTVMAGDVALEQNRHAGPPAWEIELLAGPEMAPYVDQEWLRRLRRQPPSEQALIWATQRPPVHLAYWLRHRRDPDRAGTAGRTTYYSPQRPTPGGHMQGQSKEPSAPPGSPAGAQPVKKRYDTPHLRTYGSVRDLTMTNAAGPNFDGGGGANIYAS